MYQTESPRITAQVLNQNWLEKTASHDKRAQQENNAFVRDRMRQESFWRNIVPPALVRDDELDRSLDHDLPRKIVEKEPDSVATHVPFKGTGRRVWFSGQRYEVGFGKVESQRFIKSKFELMTYQNDIRKILTDNIVKDMSDQEDIYAWDTVNAIMAANPGQKLTPSGGLNANNVVNGMKNLLSRKIPIGKILCTKELYMDALKLPATSVGDIVASRHYDEGIESEANLWGIPVITTIKNDIIPANTMLICGPSEYIGNFFLLQDATLYIKQEADILEFWSYSAMGIGFGNHKSLTMIEF